ncbi:MAG TPA: RidA family protein [Alphaproteobacteria bacterium]|jgi:enamine deaminase RidA (YjgF/YER057c/UK114 family)|nr:RidA family protein [Alphaproteobacteria bacterium]MDP6271697.1 RidA family protein [Alphaproteobacteria bacterium]MDP7164336.1 RidA family protein [Alphaproteobacteria bacterium]MDP7428750.1 RidA family protein [Alphaproteobacteria bacterium]HJM51024.1 RidA family protein [Alphaproteobacteria bacterium]|tara:strand:- start:558 stop:941 length:384 start_codon:yes stop_codon:yes gene_type:complete
MNRIYNPEGVHTPVGNYHHGCEVPAGARWLMLAGQVGVKPDGTWAEGAAAQAEQACRNIVAILAEADMGPEDIVKLVTYPVGAEHIPAVRAARDEVLGVAPPATLIVVPALAVPEALIEIEAIAAKA